jgi:hypothetical protein
MQTKAGRSGPERPRSTHTAWLGGVFLGLLAAGLAAPASGVEIVCPDEWELVVVDLINEERAAEASRTGQAIPELEIDVRLVAAARRHSLDMAENEFLGHVGSDGSTPWDRMADAGYAGGAGETAGAGYSSPEAIVSGWMNSSSHRQILLGPGYRHVGVGYAANPGARSPLYWHLWTANFGTAREPAYGVDEYCGAEPACRDGIDNDRDGRIDFPFDPQCRKPNQLSERPACSDGFDNDGDGRFDHPEDPECTAPAHFSESSAYCGLGFELAAVVPLLGAWRLRLARRPRDRGRGRARPGRARAASDP